MTIWNIILLLYYIGVATFYMLMPASFLFEYESVVPVKSVFDKTETITMISNSKFYSDLDVKWVDVLSCPPINFYNHYSTEGSIKKGHVGGQWRYQAATPDIITECFIHSTITATKDIGWLSVSKQQTIDSQHFLIQ